MISSKNIGPFLAFNNLWFAKHQKKLLWLANHPILKVPFRYSLRIHKDVGWNERIVQLQPNNYKTFQGFTPEGYLKLRADFRTHNKFSKRIYHSFSPVWWTLHSWDSILADRWIPQLSAGFATLEKYPDPHPESNTVDGYCGVYGANLSWADIIIAAGTDSSDTAALFLSYIMAVSGTSDKWLANYRSHCLFDTSSLTAVATLLSSILSAYGSYKVDNILITPSANVYSSTSASNTAIANADYGQCGSTAFSTAITYASYSTSAYNDFTLNASGLAAISLTGISKFSFRNANYDVAASPPTWRAVATKSSLEAYGADSNVGTTYDPKLVVNYALPMKVNLITI